MSNVTNAIKKVAVALGYGSDVSEYTGDTVAGVLKEVAVKMECASSVENVRHTGVVEVLNFIADNYGSEEKEPYDLSRTTTKTTVTVKRKGKAVSDGSDLLYNGDKLVITAEADEGYELSTLTVNDEDFTSGDTFVVDGGKVVIAAVSTLVPEGGDPDET